MRSDWTRLVVMATLLVVGGAMEEMLPHVGGIGVPLLLLETIWFSLRGMVFEALLFAVAAGAMEEALSSLPMMSAVSVFVIVAIAVRWIWRKAVMA